MALNYNTENDWRYAEINGRSRFSEVKAEKRDEKDEILVD